MEERDSNGLFVKRVSDNKGNPVKWARKSESDDWRPYDEIIKAIETDRKVEEFLDKTPEPVQYTIGIAAITGYIILGAFSFAVLGRVVKYIFGFL
jgi:hypothetical protein